MYNLLRNIHVFYLKKNGKIIVNNNSLCRRVEETCNHVLLRCPITYNLWIMAYEFLGISWIMVRTVRDEIWGWDGICRTKKHVASSPLLFLDCVKRKKYDSF